MIFRQSLTLSFPTACFFSNIQGANETTRNDIRSARQLVQRVSMGHHRQRSTRATSTAFALGHRIKVDNELADSFSKLLSIPLSFSIRRPKLTVDLPSNPLTTPSDIINTDVSERMKRSCGLRQNTLDGDFHSTKRLAPIASEQRRASMTMAPR